MITKTRDLAFIGIFAAIIAVMAQISIPMPAGVPMTMQTFAIPLAGVVLGARKGTIATCVYVLLGVAGLPVFAGFNGGIGALLNLTGGFIVSFPLLAYTAGIGEQGESRLWLVLWLAIGAAANFLFGALWFSFVSSTNLSYAFSVCVLPFIPTSILKITLVAMLGRQVKAVLAKHRVLPAR